MKMQQKRYSDAFKRHVCEEVKSGKWTSTREAAKAYNVTHSTVAKWLDMFGYAHIRQRIMHVNTPEEANQLAKLKAEIKQLKAQLFDAMLDDRINRAALKVACSQLDADPETFIKAASQPTTGKVP